MVSITIISDVGGIFTMAKQDEYARITLRIPASLHAQINEACEKTNRSMNSEIIERLKQSFDDFMPGMSRGELATSGAKAMTTFMGAIVELAIRRALEAAKTGETSEEVLRDILEHLNVEEEGKDFIISLNREH